MHFNSDLMDISHLTTTGSLAEGEVEMKEEVEGGGLALFVSFLIYFFQ